MPKNLSKAKVKQDYIYLIQTENDNLVQQLSDKVGGERVRVESIKTFGDLKAQPFQGEIVTFIIGSDVEDPIQSAQRLHLFNKNAKIVLLSTSEKSTKNLQEAIRFSPFISKNVTCLNVSDESDWEKLSKIFQKSLQAVKYRAIIADTNSKITNEVSFRKQGLQQQFINKLLDITPVGIAIVNRQGKILGWNKEATSIFGKNESQVLGTSLSQFFEHEEVNKLEDYLRSSIIKSDDIDQVEALEVKREIQNRSNQILNITSARFDYSGEPEKVIILVINDITVRKESEQRLEILNRSLEVQTEELAASNAELEQFAFVVSHDLQEPLRMISGFMAQLENKYDHLLDEKGKKYIHFATDGANRMRQIILDLLEYSRVGRVDIEREEINMNDLVEEAQLLNKKLITELSAEIKVENLPVINAAKVHMRQLFQNLINNAIKYHKKDRKPKVNISAGEDEGFWHFEIEDNGIGIEPENTAKIFNIFHRLHGKEEYDGSGIGLAICKKIVESHGGKIEVVSEPGKGSIFSFSIAKKQVAHEE